jgi:hypothetical protein
MQRRMHPFILLLAVAGLIPFIGCALGVMALPDNRAAQFLVALVGYGAVGLSFLGGVHWGIVLLGPEDAATRPRLALGIVPSLIGWVALLLPLILPMEFSLGVLIAGFAAAVLTEARMHRAGLMPSAYMWLRWGLSIVVVATLVTVLTLRLLGAKIIF